VTEPRELSHLVPVNVLAEVNTAVTVLETYGPAVTEAPRQLDRATTVAWKAVNLAEVTDDERAARETHDRDRPWLGCGLPAGLQPRPAWPGHPTTLTDATRHTRALWRARRAIERRTPLVACPIRGVRLFGPRNAGHAGGVSSEVDGRVRPTLRPGTAHRPAGRAPSTAWPRLRSRGEGIPWPPGPQPLRCRGWPPTAAANEAAGWTERQRCLSPWPR
jgi:hypothetical protein